MFRGPRCNYHFPDRVISVVSTTNLLGGDGISSDTGTTIGREQFVNGHALHCFDLTPDLSCSCGHHLIMTKSGNLRLELGFEVINYGKRIGLQRV